MSADLASAVTEVDLASARREFDIACERLKMQKERMRHALDLAAPGTVVTVLAAGEKLYRYARGPLPDDAAIRSWVDIESGARWTSGEVAVSAVKVALGWHDNEGTM